MAKIEKKISPIEKKFTEELLKRCEEAKKLCGSNPTRFVENVNKFGGVKTAKEILRKGKVSDGFEKLKEEDLLQFTMEALVSDRQYGELFTDEEVNSCYEVLCENGYYK
ncbi:MAG: hypothetical protein ACRCSG_07600 [Cellulosilyticaceae bacterium]